MKKTRILKVCIISFTILLFLLAFEWINVESYWEDQAFVGNNVELQMSHDLFIIKSLLVITAISLFISIYKLSKANMTTEGM